MSSEAYNLYLQGQYFRARRSKEDLERAAGFYEQALRLDPGYAPAWVGLAGVHGNQADAAYVPPQEGFTKSRQDAEKALTLDPNLAEAHVALGRIRMFHDWDWPGADDAFKRAFELEPGNATVVRVAALLATVLGRFDDARDLGRRSLELDPLSLPSHLTFGLGVLRGGRLDEAEAAYRNALALNAEYPSAHMQLGRVYSMQSKPEAALQQMEQEKEPFWRRFGLALAYQGLGRKREADAALAELLEKDAERAAFQIAETCAFRGKRRGPSSGSSGHMPNGMPASLESRETLFSGVSKATRVTGRFWRRCGCPCDQRGCPEASSCAPRGSVKRGPLGVDREDVEAIEWSSPGSASPAPSEGHDEKRAGQPA